MSISIDGTGSISGISVGGLTDGCVTPSDLSQPLTLETAKSATGTAVDFTGIPSWVKRVTVMLDGVSVNSTSSFLIQLGDAGGIETTGYSGGGGRFGVSTFQAATFTAGFGFNNTTAACLYSGNIIINKLSGNTWAASGTLGGTATEVVNITGGSKTLSDTLTQLRITTVNGTDTFDAGTINIMYE